MKLAKFAKSGQRIPLARVYQKVTQAVN